MGITVLLIGVARAIVDAYLFLIKDISILPVFNFAAAFGEALTCLIEASIRMIYLGVMGWIGSTVTIRGITFLLYVTLETKSMTPKKAEAKAEPKYIEEDWRRLYQKQNWQLSQLKA